MPDPPHITFHYVRGSDSTTQQHHRQQLSDTGHMCVADGNSRDSTHTEREHGSGDYSPNPGSAYAADLAPDGLFSNSAYASHNASSNTSVNDSQSIAGASYSLVRDSNAAPAPNLNLATFGSQPWPTTSAPYLEFAPQPIYEPTGELLHETITEFAEFNDPSNFKQREYRNQSAVSTSNDTAQPVKGTAIQSGNLDSSATSYNNAQGFTRPVLKRAFVSDTSIEVSQTQAKQQRIQQTDRSSRRVTFDQMSSTAPISADDEDSSVSDAAADVRTVSHSQASNNPTSSRGYRHGNTPAHRGYSAETPTARKPSRGTGRGNRTPSGHPPSILPPEKVFPVQIGSELFRLSGASISSDAPSYFTQFFEQQIIQNEDSGGVRTLYIDRDPETFRDIARHLQGYYIRPRDGSHFVKLFADAQFYSLPRLISQLFEAEIFIQIGESHFQIPKDIFSDPGNSPNFFSLGFAVFFSTPGEVFPGLDRRGLLRPPSITPPYVPGRSAQIFAQLLHLLRGYPLHIRDDDHRTELLRDCRYFHLRGLEQQLIAHEISYNLERQIDEICLRIEDIKPSGVSYKGDEDSNTGGWVRYARPFVDGNPYELVVEIGGETTMLDLNDMRLDFHGLAKARISSLFQVIANKMNLPTNAPLGAMMLAGVTGTSHASPGNTPLSEDRVKVRFEAASDVVIDGGRYDIDWNSQLGQCMVHGPPELREDENSDAMSEDDQLKQPLSRRKRSRGSQSNVKHTESGQASTTPRGSLSTGRHAPRIDTTFNPSNKRGRQTMSASTQDEWVIRSGQWRLRVQQNERDPIRGGYEIVFVAVKIDAFSQERARNSRRKFLGGGA